MSMCGKTKVGGGQCLRPVTNGSCGAKHVPLVGSAVKGGRRVGRIAGRTVGRKASGVAGAATFGIGKAGFLAVSKIDPTEMEDSVKKGVKDGQRTGERAVPKRYLL